VVVKDDGPGFPADLADRLFERFFQVDGSETRRHGGTGIGLALAKDIVELHGGRIRAESDHGARFTVELIKDKEHFRPDALDRRSQRRDVVAGSRAGDRGVHEFAAQLQSREEFRLLDIVEATERRVIARDPGRGQARAQLPRRRGYPGRHPPRRDGDAAPFQDALGAGRHRRASSSPAASSRASSSPI